MTDPSADPPPAIEALLERHLPALRAFVRLRTAKAIRDRESQSDLLQSICRELLEGEARFDYQGEAQFRNWLYTAALRKLTERDRYHRAQARDVAREVRMQAGADSAAAVVDLYATVTTPSVHAASAEEMARIEAAFERLPEQQREVITLARIVGLPHKDIATQLGLSEANCRQLLRRGLVRLETILDGMRQQGAREPLDPSEPER